MAESANWQQVPPFGSWGFLEASSQSSNSSFNGGRFYHSHVSEDLYTVPWKARRGRMREKREEREGEGSEFSSQKLPRRRSQVHMAVDEDLYKIPPELLRRKSTRKTPAICKFLSGCLCMS